MKIKWKLLTSSLCLSLLLGGCFGTDKSVTQKSSDGKDDVPRSDDMYESILTYTGDGYDLPGGDKNEKFAKDHKDDVEKAVKDYLKNEFNTDVNVHNMVGNRGGVTVFYESTGPLHFYATAIVPIDLKNKDVVGDHVWTLEGVVERGIKGALYAYLFEDEFKELDRILGELENEEDIVGRKIEAIENVGGIGYMTPFYFLANSTDDEAIEPVYELYMKDPETPKAELRSAFDKEQFIPEDYLFSIQFYMEDPNKEPDEAILERIVNTIVDSTTIPSGNYAINLHDNYVIKHAAEGSKDNSISRKFPDEEIIKE
ncbi:DUF1672 family protein [Rossellomorea marisflavi]|uniref:DUF1672 family protein n=1 Tax=Rossellomorea marisflavi TaxID=189381 RepID=UPI003D2B3D37